MVCDLVAIRVRRLLVSTNHSIQCALLAHLIASPAWKSGVAAMQG